MADPFAQYRAPTGNPYTDQMPSPLVLPELPGKQPFPLFQLTDDQRVAMDSIGAWTETAKPSDMFRMFGYAGVGKTSCSIALKSMPHPKRGRPFSVLYVAFTNRAVSVLQSKGCYPARTAHSILYSTNEYESEDEKAEHTAMKQAYLNAVLAGVPAEDRPKLPPNTKKLGFSLREPEDLAMIMCCYDVVAVDEASMIGSKMGADLWKLRRPIIGIGDPGQLPPVNDSPFFPVKDPEVLLTKILRTDNDILALATHVRTGGLFVDAPEGKNYTIRRKALPEWFDVDQVLCGIHDKRKKLNAHIRALRGYTGVVPNVGEKLMSVANNRDLGIMNGQLWTVTAVRRQGDYAVMDLIEYAPRKDPLLLDIRTDIRVHLECLKTDIKDSTEMGCDVRYDSCLFCWGYAITTHKAQGSEFNSVLVFDDSHVFRQFSRNWAYTAVTRAAQTLYVVSR